MGMLRLQPIYCFIRFPQLNQVDIETHHTEHVSIGNDEQNKTIVGILLTVLRIHLSKPYTGLWEIYATHNQNNQHITKTPGHIHRTPLGVCVPITIYIVNITFSVHNQLGASISFLLCYSSSVNWICWCDFFILKENVVKLTTQLKRNCVEIRHIQDTYTNA